jgi:putative ABC transport system permease protein
MLRKLRSLLTMLGTVLGVASVIAMLAIGEGSKRRAVEQIRKLGATNVIVRSIKPAFDEGSGQRASGSGGTVSSVLEYGLRYADLERLTASLPNVIRAVPIALVRRNAQHEGYRLANARILGTIPEYLETKQLNVCRGRFLADADLASTANVAVLGAGAARRLFGFGDPLDNTVLLGDGAYQVIGVLASQDSGSAVPGAADPQDFNDDIYVPLSAAQRRFGELQMIVRSGSREFERTQLNEITLTVSHERFVAATAEMARRLLAVSHADATDYDIQIPLELLRQAEHQKRIWNLVLGSIAGISLVVGGIGIMNIMLATVTERTREIGIRRALGARRRDIVSQFLIETLVLSTAGGLIGVFVGVAIPMGVSAVTRLETTISAWSIVLAFAISLAVGIVFGVYPARRAARMNPIEALRHT